METYHGHVRTPADAIILFEACRIGMLPRVQRRLSEKERQLIQSGSVFVWDEREAGMRRWTDGKSWSASRVSGSFLTYREMEGKRGGTSVPTQPPRTGKTPDSSRGSDDDRGDGPDDGPDGYRYKPDGLMKQSFSITTSTGQHLHLISYYSRSHPNAANLLQPSNDPALRGVRPQKGLYPESTVNDQQNLPVVTRGPMTGTPYAVPPPPPPPPPAHHHMAAYARSSAPHPQSYAPGYAWPPTPMGTPPAVSIHHYPAYITPAPHPPPPPPQYHALPPPPPPSQQQPGLPPGYERAVHPLENPLHPSHMMQQGPLLMPARSPRVIAEHTPPEYATDHRRASPRIQPHASPHANGVPIPAVRSPRILTQAPPPPSGALNIPPSNSPSRPPSETNSHTATVVPSINVLMNGAPSSALPSISAAASASTPAGSGAPVNGRPGDGPRDIPSDKIGFGGEDMRALRQLDKAFGATS